eukprot:Hpha_TRINITY_DN13219_c0_g2::TRINITY_DN13219_c0_g2_i1::g.154740::m.154740
MSRLPSTTPAQRLEPCHEAVRRLCVSALVEADSGTGTAALRRRLVREKCTARIGELQCQMAEAEERERDLVSKMHRLQRKIKKRCLKEFGLSPEAERRRGAAAQRLGAVEGEADPSSKLPAGNNRRVQARTVRMAINQHWSEASLSAQKEFKAEHARELEVRRRLQAEQKSFLDAQNLEREAARAEERERVTELARSAQRSTEEWRQVESRVAASNRQRLMNVKEEMDEVVAARSAARQEARRQVREELVRSLAAEKETERREREERLSRKKEAVAEYREHLRREDERRCERRRAGEEEGPKSGVPDDGVLLRQRKAKAEEVLAAKQAPCLAMLEEAAERRRAAERKAREEELEQQEWERQDELRRKQAVFNRNKAHREALDVQLSAHKAEELTQQVAVVEENCSLRRLRQIEKEEDKVAARRRVQEKRKRAGALSTLAEARDRTAFRGVTVKVI